ncbi:MAG: UvrB/UvrC motif-containing protein [Clostridia bacterium]|nr:UvrB/UvrC motif-containing protein [Clostridia bacterium]
MKCAKCNEKEGIVYIYRNINGVASKTVLCMDCAKEVELKELKRVENIMANYMKNMFMPVSFRNSFWNPIELEDEIYSMSNLLDVGIWDEEKVQPQKQVRNEKTKEEQKRELEIKLKKAVEEERYEDAAVIRDKMKELK